jgi:transposase-like protein
LSHRDVEELLAERGIAVSYETVRRWCLKFGAAYADGVRRRRPRPGDKWHLDEVQLKINGTRHWLWRAVDQEGVVLDILVQRRRNQEVAEAFLRRVLNGQGYEPRVVITDTLASYPPAVRRVLPRAQHRRHKGLNNRAENSHRPTRRRERALQRFSHRSTRSSSSPPSARSATTSVFAGTASQRPSTTSCCRPGSPPGARSQASPPLRKPRCGPPRENTPARLPFRVYVTVPARGPRPAPG